MPASSTTRCPIASRDRAFTLVELLVVIGIIALLISILLPSLNKAREAANTVACASNMRQTGQAIHMFVAEQKGQLPMAEFPWDGETGTNYPWARFYTALVGTKAMPISAIELDKWWLRTDSKVFHCPSDTTVESAYYDEDDGSQWRGVGHDGFGSSYFLNLKVFPWWSMSGGGSGPYGQAYADTGPMKVTQFKTSSERLIMTEKPATGFMGGFLYSPELRQLGGPEDIVDNVRGRHGGRRQNVNVLFLDGHVDAMDVKIVTGPAVRQLAGEDQPNGHELWGLYHR